MDSFKAMSERLRTPEDYELITYNMVRALAAQGWSMRRSIFLWDYFLLEARPGGAVRRGD